MEQLRLALSQMDPTLGDIRNNERAVIEGIQEAKQQGADLVVFPELALAGYPPEDLLLRPAFLDALDASLARVVDRTEGITAIVGHPVRHDDLHNSAVIAHDGDVIGTHHKQHLPTYGVFDEDRYFAPGTKPTCLEVGPFRIALSVCEDIWYPSGPGAAVAQGPGADVILNLSASPFHLDKATNRERMLRTRACDHLTYLGFCNLVGGQDELVFDGGSMIVGPGGEVLASAPSFEEALIFADLDLRVLRRQRLRTPRTRRGPSSTPSEGFDGHLHTLLPLDRTVPRPALPNAEDRRREQTQLASVYQALVCGTQAYVHKNGFERVTLGLSGGIDSSLVACIAADALGPENVTGVAMPSRYTSLESKEDARELAKRLGIRFETINIEGPFKAFLEALEGPFEGHEPDVTEENLQARIRGTLLMALSNKFGWLVLTTGNKSENAVGYATLYGDMAGGFAPIKDVPKTMVYDLCRYRNGEGTVIPDRVLTKPPTAELREDQRDDQSLPPYEILDPILEAYIEHDASLDEIVEAGYDKATVHRITGMVDRAEHKRRQAPPGIKVTPRAFGKDRRLPITNRFQEGRI